MHLGEVIKKYRYEHGKMSMQAFADKCGLSKGYIAMLERNVNSKTGEPIVPSAETFIKVSKAMGMSLNDLSKIVDENQPISIRSEEFTITASPLPSNLVSPAAYPLPVLGTICAGDGILCEENFEGYFFVDNTIRANYCLHVHGDSMMDAEIYDEDIVFIRKDFEYEDGKIYAVVFGAQQDAVLRKIYRDGGKVILTPCNSSYKPLVMDPDDIFIIGECVGVYRLMK